LSWAWKAGRRFGRWLAFYGEATTNSTSRLSPIETLASSPLADPTHAGWQMGESGSTSGAIACSSRRRCERPITSSRSCLRTAVSAAPAEQRWLLRCHRGWPAVSRQPCDSSAAIRAADGDHRLAGTAAGAGRYDPLKRSE